MTVKHLEFLTLPDELSIKLPASKSISNRVLILNALAYSPYDVQNLANCDDTNVLVKVLNSNDRIFDIGAAQERQEANKTAKQFEQNLSKESCPTKTKFNKMQRRYRDWETNNRS